MATIQWAQPTEVGTPASVDDGGEIDESLDLEDLEGNAWTDTYDEEWTCSNGTPSPSTGRTNTATVTWEGGSDSRQRERPGRLQQHAASAASASASSASSASDGEDGRVHGRAGDARTRHSRCSS